MEPILNGTGFKATSGNLTCFNKFKYDIGQIYIHTGPLKICKSGFHLCKQLDQTFNFYDPAKRKDNRYFVVSYDDRTVCCYEDNGESGCDPKVITSAIRLETEIKVEEYLEMTDIVKMYATEHLFLYFLRYAYSQNANVVIKQLLDAGADVHVRDDRALRLASRDGRTEMVRLLLDYGADVHARDDEALRNACGNGHTEMVRLLLEAGSDVHADDDIALRCASYWGYSDIVKLLLEAGADVHAKDNELLQWASQGSRYWVHTETIKLLLKCGTNANDIDKNVL